MPRMWRRARHANQRSETKKMWPQWLEGNKTLNTSQHISTHLNTSQGGNAGEMKLALPSDSMPMSAKTVLVDQSIYSKCFQETKLPERIEKVGKPSLRHLGTAIVVASGAVVDAAQRAQAAMWVLLPRVANSFNDLLVTGFKVSKVPKRLSLLFLDVSCNSLISDMKISTFDQHHNLLIMKLFFPMNLLSAGSLYLGGLVMFWEMYFTVLPTVSGGYCWCSPPKPGASGGAWSP